MVKVQVPVTKDGKIKATVYIEKKHLKEVNAKVKKAGGAEAYWGENLVNSAGEGYVEGEEG